jgi:hypothetical protein
MICFFDGAAMPARMAAFRVCNGTVAKLSRLPGKRFR